MNMNMMDDTLDTLEAMLHQEDAGYAIPAFLGHLPQHTAYGQPVDAQARQAIAEWCYKIMTICHYTNETAEIAVSCLDRYVATRPGYSSLLDRQQYQLAALAAVYTAVKIHEQQALSPDLVAKLSNGVFKRDDIEEMEVQMLKALKWRVNPATTMDFVRVYLSLIPKDVLDPESRKLALELSQLQIDRSILEYDFCTTKKSQIAFASLLNSVESIYTDGRSSYVESLISHSANIDTSSLQRLSDKLYEAIASHPEAKMLQATQTRRKSSSLSSYSVGNNKWSTVNPAPHSPRSVYHMA